MPFNVSKAAAHERRIVLRFNEEKMTVRYNAGIKYREYQKQAQKLEQEYEELGRRLQADNNTEADFQALITARAGARRRLANNLCIIINEWDLEGDLDEIKGNMAAEDRKRFKETEGSGTIPVDGAWLDALPLPDEFIIAVANGISEDFEAGGSAGKALSVVS